MLIMMHGYTAVGKSSVASYLSSHLPDTKILHTAVVRKELRLAVGQDDAPSYKYELDDRVFLEVSGKVYATILQKAKSHLDNGRNVILDGTYNFFWQREGVYELAHSGNTHVAIVNCLCANEQELKKRLDERAQDSSSPFAEANDWKTYLSTKHLSEPVDNDRLPDGKAPHILKYDTFMKELICPECESCDSCGQVASTLNRMIKECQD